MDWFLFQFDIGYLLTVLTRILVACFLGGIIGFEREYTRQKPAGLRTHILVSLGSCLVMLISHFAVTAYGGTANVDPTRIGGQVVSGIGFLGAGAIIRHGVSVKGITTAASIWAVACVGLACGVGFYSGAILATILIWLVLMWLKSLENKLTSRKKSKIIEIEAPCEAQIVLPLNSVLKNMNLTVKSLEVAEIPDTQRQRIICQVESKKNALDFALISAKINEIEGVLKVSL